MHAELYKSPLLKHAKFEQELQELQYNRNCLHTELYKRTCMQHMYRRRWRVPKKSQCRMCVEP